MENKTAVVTGATSGIGLEVSIALIQRGAKVYLIGRNFKVLKERLLKLDVDVEKIQFISADFTVVSQLKRINIDNNIDSLIHCAGIISLGSFEADSLENLDRQHKVNVAAPFYITQKLLPKLKSTEGQIIFLNSTAGLDSWENIGLYSSSKHALKALATTLRKEIATSNVKVTNIFLGSVDTPMQEKVQKIRNIKYDPTRFISAKNIAEVIMFIIKMQKNLEISDITIR